MPPQQGYRKGDTLRKQRAPLTTGGGQGRVAGAGALIVLNTVVTILEYAPVFIFQLEKGKVEDHFQTLINYVFNDINTAIEEGLINITEMNKRELVIIANILLFGYDQKDENWYNITKDIYRNISKFKKK